MRRDVMIITASSRSAIIHDRAGSCRIELSCRQALRRIKAYCRRPRAESYWLRHVAADGDSRIWRIIRLPRRLFDGPRSIARQMGLLRRLRWTQRHKLRGGISGQLLDRFADARPSIFERCVRPDSGGDDVSCRGATKMITRRRTLTLPRLFSTFRHHHKIIIAAVMLYSFVLMAIGQA